MRRLRKVEPVTMQAIAGMASISRSSTEHTRKNAFAAPRRSAVALSGACRDILGHGLCSYRLCSYGPYRAGVRLLFPEHAETHSGMCHGSVGKLVIDNGSSEVPPLVYTAATGCPETS